MELMSGVRGANVWVRGANVWVSWDWCAIWGRRRQGPPPRPRPDSQIRRPQGSGVVWGMVRSAPPRRASLRTSDRAHLFKPGCYGRFGGGGGCEFAPPLPKFCCAGRHIWGRTPV